MHTWCRCLSPSAALSPIYIQPRARRVWARRTNGLKIVSTQTGFGPTISRLKVDLVLLIPKPHFLDLLLLNFNGIVSSKIYDKRDDFYFDIINSPFLDGDAPRSLLMVSTFLNLFILLEYLVIWLTSMVVTKLWLPNFFNRGIDITNLGKLFLSFIVDTTNYFLNKIPPSGHMSFIQRRLNVDATSWRCIDVEATLC